MLFNKYMQRYNNVSFIYYIIHIVIPSATQLTNFLKLVRVTFQSLRQYQINLYATLLTYCTLLAIVPTLAVLFAILKSFGIDATLKRLIAQLLAPMGDSGRDVSDYLLNFVNNAQAGLLGGVGLFFLLYSIFSLLRNVELVLNDIWGVEQKRAIRKQITNYLGAIMLTTVLSTCAISLNVIFHNNDLLTSIKDIPGASVMVLWSVKILSILITAFLLASIYHSTINCDDIKYSAVFAGGLFCTIVWIPLTALFKHFIVTSGNYSLIYSGFASLIILLIWLKILWGLFLFGALLANFVNYPSAIKISQNEPLNPAEQEFFAQQILHHIIAAFKSGKGGVRLKHLIMITKLDKNKIITILTPFLKSNIVIKTHDNSYTLGIPIDIATDELIIKTIRGTVR